MDSDISIKKTNFSVLPAMQQAGTNNFYVTNQEGGTVNFNIIYQKSSPTNSAEMMMAIKYFSKEYYQLIVICDEEVFANNVVYRLRRPGTDKI